MSKFEQIVKDRITTAKHPRFGRPYTDLVYQPMLELLAYLRANGFKTYIVSGGGIEFMRLPEVDFIDDKTGEPVAIHKLIGRRPVAAFGNSDGDFEMLEWVTAGPGPRFGLLVHHTDAGREGAYDRQSHVGRLARGLDEAPERGRVLVDRKKEWKIIYPFQK